MRAIVLGASNLRRGLPTVVAAARQALDASELDVYGAFGHGRSYKLTTTVFGRTVPGILECGLWRALLADPSPAVALLTDIGNDLGYGVDAGTLADWVDEALRRLAACGARRIVLTAPPVQDLERRPDWQIGLARRLFFPFSTLTAKDVRREVADLVGLLRELAAEHGAAWIEPDPAWYGADPIHLRSSHLNEAWPRILAPWSDEPPPASVTPPPWAEGRLLFRSRPKSFVVLGHERGHEQPAVTLPGPLRLFLF